MAAYLPEKRILAEPASDLPLRGTVKGADCLAGGGNMGALMRDLDWSRTPVGAVDGWPQSLRTAISTILASGFPMLVLWGKDYTQFYNDAYRPVLGATKHPDALGQRARDCWPEIWSEVLEPMFGQVMAGGDPIWSEDMLFVLDRNGYLEETFFTFSYSAIRDESGAPGGVLVTCVETTSRVVAERRMRTLRELAAHSSKLPSVDEACRRAADILATNREDLPLALLYLAEPEQRRVRLVGGFGIPRDAAWCPDIVALEDDDGSRLPWPIASAIREPRRRVLTDLQLPFVPEGALWPESPHSAVVLPIAHPGASLAMGVLVAGVSPRRALDSAYYGFFELVASHLGTAITNARAYEAERKRAEALAELDRAKTTFFSNISHEFRTPLTLLLAPIEDALASPSLTLGGDKLEQAHRNARRLLRLVNNLLDFSRIEAGRIQASYVRCDIAALTADLASAFRSAIEHAGLQYRVRCDPVSEPVYVDRDMWEKIVLNLLSNALKFTFVGFIEVFLVERENQVELTVRDTGVGIPEAELPRIFERFHRVEGMRARTHEGSGIGLALIDELVRLHGGEIAVSSREGEGSTFVVRVPTGCAHLPAERIDVSSTLASTAWAAASFLDDEVSRWSGLAGAHAEDPARLRRSAAAKPLVSRQPIAGRESVLVADDNADMRDYLCELLHENWNVESAADGLQALQIARGKRVDLIVADVMMPGLDGFSLLRELRENERTRAIPLVMLSARAGEEARIEGISAGADDYIPKPFSARELIARVRSLLALSRAQRQAHLQRQQLYSLFMQAPTPIVILKGPQYLIELANPLACQIWGRKHEDVIGRPLFQALHELADQPFKNYLDEVLRTGVSYVGKETPAEFDRGGEGKLETFYFNFVYAALRDLDDRIEGIMVIASDVTDEIKAREAVDRLRAAAEAANRAKDEFLAMLGHELRNPLAPIVTALQMMSLRGDATVSRERAIIDRQVRHLARLIDDLLDVSRIARGKIKLNRESLEIADVISHAIEMASPLLEERQHRLLVDLPREGLRVWGDATRLAQVIMNLLTNAAKYTEPRGQVHVRAQRDGEFVSLTVKDNGIGISAEMLPCVFDVFVQGRQTFDRSRGGLGLGLTIVRSLVEMHGGTVAALSAGIGEGSEFLVRLPAEPLPVARKAKPDETLGRSSDAPRRRILVVDDNVDAAQLMAEALRLVGHETRTAFDGPSALMIARGFKPDVALLDLGLPVMDGYELAQRLSEEFPEAPPLLIAVTGYGREHDRKRSRLAGFRAHLVKPIDLDQLIESLDAVTSARESPEH